MKEESPEPGGHLPVGAALDEKPQKRALGDVPIQVCFVGYIYIYIYIYIIWIGTLLLIIKYFNKKLLAAAEAAI